MGFMVREKVLGFSLRLGFSQVKVGEGVVPADKRHVQDSQAGS